MPEVPRGHVFYYNFGPAYGAELADNRAALIISNDDTNSGRLNYIALPTSQSEPPVGQRSNHVHIADSADWASIQKITTVNLKSLGDYIGEANQDELRLVVTTIQRRLGTSHKVGTIETAERLQCIRPGTVFQTILTNYYGKEIPSTLAIIDYNDGNKVALTVRLHFPPKAPNSRISVPVTIQSTGEPGSAMVNQIRPIHLPEYDLSEFEEIYPNDVVNIVDQLLTVIDE